MQHVMSGAIAGVFVFVALIASIFLSGGTFGQRCEAKGYHPPTGAYDLCVRAMEKGETVHAMGEKR